MSLKQSVVIVNEYTIKNAKGGSRGGSPGSYVLRYMARDKAVEDLTPVRFDNEDYILRYMAREEATEVCDSVPNLKRSMRKIQGKGGIAFGYGEVSLSHKQLLAASKDIQKNFDNGKTVLKTVLSFDEEYLRDNNIIDDDFEFKKKGDYRGNIDQMKLRMAIMNGLDRLGRQYDDLQYIGVIQVDTAHVHCHLAMVDRGVGTLAKDGTQKGKISEKGKKEIRRGIDMFLDDKQAVRMMTSNVTHDKRNALCFIKKYTHKTMDKNGFTQFLVACLPNDKRKWRANTNDKEMRKANELTREFVMQVLAEPDSGYREAMQDINKYAIYRRDNEGLSMAEYDTLVRAGRDRLISDCMNGVYATIKNIPDSQRNIRTPLLDVMSADYSEIIEEHRDDPIIEFGFKLRSYASRLDHHKKERNKYKAAVKHYDDTENVSEDSKPLYDFFKEEEEYNTMLMAKYQHFLAFLPAEEEYEEDFKRITDYEARMDLYDRMRNDPSPARMSAENAEDYCLRVYGMHGGRYATFDPSQFDKRYDIMKLTYDEMRLEFNDKLLEYGLVYDGRGVKHQTLYEFDDVKALDLHHLRYDWTYDVPISKRNVDAFINVANVRHNMYEAACEYLHKSEQDFAIDNLPGEDIKIMKNLADKMQVNAVLVSNKASGDKIKPRNTIPLTVNYDLEFHDAVQSTLKQIQF